MVKVRVITGPELVKVFIKEGGNWKVKSGHFTQLHGGSGIPN
jgi:hypothetical protein